MNGKIFYAEMAKFFIVQVGYVFKPITGLPVCPLFC